MCACQLGVLTPSNVTMLMRGGVVRYRCSDVAVDAKPTDPAAAVAMARTAYAMSLLMQVKAFLKSLYRLTNKKCLAFVPTVTGGSKAQEHAVGVVPVTLPSLASPPSCLYGAGVAEGACWWRCVYVCLPVRCWMSMRCAALRCELAYHGACYASRCGRVSVIVRHFLILVDPTAGVDDVLALFQQLVDADPLDFASSGNLAKREPGSGRKRPVRPEAAAATAAAAPPSTKKRGRPRKKVRRSADSDGDDDDDDDAYVA